MSDGVAPQAEEKSDFQLTREMELVISGALVFTLLQMPELIDGWWQRVSLHVSGAAFGAPFAAFYIGKVAAYGLIVTIVLHFLLRGFWVALMGMRSVYPEGVDPNRLEQGAFFRDFYRNRLLSIAQLEDRTDKVAASIFSFVFVFLMFLVVMSFWAAASGLVALAIASATGTSARFRTVFYVVFGAFILLQMIPALVDRMSKKGSVSPSMAAVANRIMRFAHYASLNFLYAPLVFTFSTRLSRRVFTAAQLTFVYSMLAVFALSTFAASGLLGYDSYIFFPSNARETTMRAEHYDDLRGEGDTAAMPSIQSEIIGDDYVRLFLPYNVQRDNDDLRVVCPTQRPLRSNGFFIDRRKEISPAESGALLQCFSRLTRVELDGREIATGDAEWYVQPQSGLHGRIVMIDVAQLPRGKHQLTIRRTVEPPDGDGKRRSRLYHIPFWK